MGLREHTHQDSSLPLIGYATGTRHPGIPAQVVQSAFMARRGSSPAHLPMVMAGFVTGIHTPNFERVK